jgi:putative SOS response-associated peptidase YedK
MNPTVENLHAFGFSSDVSEIKIVFSIPPRRVGISYRLSSVIRYDVKAGEPSLDLLRWGLVPYWAKDLKVGFENINAKAKGIDQDRHRASSPTRSRWPTGV